MQDKYQPVYKDMQFQNYVAYNEWLQKTYQFVITVKDEKLNTIIKIWCASSGEILTSNNQRTIENGKFVNVNDLDIGNMLPIWTYDRWLLYWYLIIEAVDIKSTGNNSFDQYIDELAKQIR